MEKFPSKNKYHAKPVIINGIRFSSQKEGKRYQELLYARKSGDCLWFLRQVPFHLDGGVKYLADFLVFWKDGKVTVEDVKGFRTPVYRVKRGWVESKYPIEITEI
jgi:hypothetical protein